MFLFIFYECLKIFIIIFNKFSQINLLIFLNINNNRYIIVNTWNIVSYIQHSWIYSIKRNKYKLLLREICEITKYHKMARFSELLYFNWFFLCHSALSSLSHAIKARCKRLILSANGLRNYLFIDYFVGGNGIVQLSDANALRYQIEIA